MVKTVREVAEDLDAWETFVRGVDARLDEGRAQSLIARLALLPVRSSRATGLLGSYAHRGGEPLCIRLQPLQEPELLRTTLLHELAHACEHLTSPQPHRHRCSHGPSWRAWALAFDIAPKGSGRSPVLNNLRQERLKPVAVCERCGCVFQRLRRLPARRSWVHPECGNGRVVPLSTDRRSRG
ncbi:MAG: SprT family zinc-dependent metalloprotease [Desulfuromonas sp.]|nr:SprT family zinc-dependent metalloprotease [Desulfuromonas sp.]